MYFSRIKRHTKIGLISLICFRYKLLKVNSQSASVVVTSLTPNTPHSFIIRAFDETGKTGPFSDVKTVATIAEDLKPGKIEGLQISSIGTRQVTLRWSKIDSRISNLDYEVLYQEENTINGLTHKEIATTEQHLVLGLAEFTRYSFVVRARNEFGFGSHSDAISCETLSDMPSGYPNDIDIITDSTERLVIKWKPPALVDWNGYLTGRTGINVLIQYLLGLKNSTTFSLKTVLELDKCYLHILRVWKLRLPVQKKHFQVFICLFSQ